MRNTLKTIETLTSCKHVVRANVDGKVLICPECGAFRLSDNAVWQVPMLTVRLARDLKDELPVTRDSLAGVGHLAEQLSASLTTVYQFAEKAEFADETQVLAEVSMVAKEVSSGIREIAERFGAPKGFDLSEVETGKIQKAF